MKKVKLQENYISALERMDYFEIKKLRRFLDLKKRNNKIFQKVLLFVFSLFISNFITISTVYLAAGSCKIIEIKINFFIFAFIFEFIVLMAFFLFNFKSLSKQIFMEILEKRNQ